MSSVVCKRCGGAVVRRGFMYGYQRYGFKACGCHFTLAPTKRLTPAHKALAVRKCWVWKAYDRATGRCVAWVVERRDPATCKQL